MYRRVTLSVGLEDQSPFDTIYNYDNRLSLTIIPKTAGIISLIVILFATVLLVYLVAATNIVRESGPAFGEGKFRRYSLSRIQTAFWFCLAATSYFCLWLITDDFNTLTPSVLGLMGISSFTAVTTHLIHAKDSGAIAPRQRSLNQLPSAGLLADLLSDAIGYSFHRFQMVAWNILLGLIFIYSAVHNLAMPDFSGGLLAVTGISAVTYLGFESLQASALQRLRFAVSVRIQTGETDESAV
jgi:hypothetical protein